MPGADATDSRRRRFMDFMPAKRSYFGQRQSEFCRRALLSHDRARFSRYSRSAALMRDCHPSPAARNASTISGSSRIVVETLRRFAGGRPRRRGAAANFLRHSSVDKSGASSPKSGGVDGLFAVIGFPHGDDATRAAAPCPNQDHRSAVEKTNRDEPVFAIVMAVVLDGQRQRRPRRRAPYQVLCARSLRGVLRDRIRSALGFFVTTETLLEQSLRDERDLLIELPPRDLTKASTGFNASISRPSG